MLVEFEGFNRKLNTNGELAAVGPKYQFGILIDDARFNHRLIVPHHCIDLDSDLIEV